MPADLLIIVPSRGRPHNIAALHDAWLQAETTSAAGLLVAADDDDPTLPDYERVCAERGIELAVGPRLRLAGTLNQHAISRAPHHFAIGFFGDDHRARSSHWDERYLEALHALGTGMVYGDDGYMGERLPTEIAMTSDIITTLGYMVPPGPIHLWIDNCWYDLGHAINRIRYLPDVLIEHMHPIAGKSHDDAGYLEVNHPDAAERDRVAYAHWLETGFDADVAKLKALL